jgi:bacterioferritin-associated ferredoxin
MYICVCKGITESDVRECGRGGYMCAQALAAKLQIDGDDCCGRCLKKVDELVVLACGGKQETDNAIVRM